MLVSAQGSTSKSALNWLIRSPRVQLKNANLSMGWQGTETILIGRVVAMVFDIRGVRFDRCSAALEMPIEASHNIGKEARTRKRREREIDGGFQNFASVW